MNLDHLTWQDILIKKGFKIELAKLLIGFISWNQGEIFSKLGKEITDVLYGYTGQVIVHDVFCSKYDHVGLLFLSEDIPLETSNKIFEIILDYEHNEVYDMHCIQDKNIKPHK